MANTPRWLAFFISAGIILQHVLFQQTVMHNTETPNAPSTTMPASIARLPTGVEVDVTKSFKAAKKQIRRVAIIGAGGYVGTRLYDYLKNYYDVTGFDRDPRIPTRKDIIVHKAADEIDTGLLHSFDAVVFLGGLTGRKACDAVSEEQVRKENVITPVRLAERMKKDQLLIFASTSAITEGSGGNPRTETDHVQQNILDSYSNSMFMREKAMRELSLEKADAPQLVALRFGTVIGHSDGQRVDMVFMALMKSAFTTGVLTVTHGESNRAFLSLEDLVRCVKTIMTTPEKAERFEIFHLKSFNLNIAGVANEVAMHTGARIVAKDLDVPDSLGFSLDSTKFETKFDFEFKMSKSDVVRDLQTHVPASITAKGVHQSAPMDVGHESGKDSIPCPVCGSHHLQETLDLHKQPLANDFRPNASFAMESPRFPLKLVRCKVCNHLYLSTIVDRSHLFSKYLYKSGTSKTLAKYFEWLADKVAKQSDHPTNGKVLEIASNDGSQLDKFKAIGWDTYGVDPAANIVPVSVEKGHKAVVGFWGMENFSHLPAPEDLDAIVAQNVFAHVPNPVGFLNACRDVMGENTKLYIQTSQCQMHQQGQFDTAYHEHISFFTGHSFYKAAQLSGLYITNFELTPIHGTSCFVTFMKANDQDRKIDVPSKGLQKRLNEEIADGINTDFFYTKYGARAKFTRSWIHNQLTGLTESGYTVGAYGAAAKGMVLLHFLREVPDRKWNLAFVLDDAPLKQNTYCPGTEIPVLPTSSLRERTETKLAFVILAWNFWKEISENIRRELAGKVDEVIIICPFPTARIIKLSIDGPPDHENVLVGIPYRPTSWPQEGLPENRRKTMVVSHFANDEHLMPHFIRHHAHMFDNALMINYGSNDSSLDIIRREAPSTWHVVSPWFDGPSVMQKFRKDDWHVTLTTNEFLVHPNLREAASEMQSGDDAVFKFPSVNVVGNNNKNLNRFESVLTQRSKFGVGSHEGYQNPYDKSSTYIYVGDKHVPHQTAVKSWPGEGVVMKFHDDSAPYGLKERDMKHLELEPECEGKDCTDPFFHISVSYHEAVVPQNPIFE